VVACVEQRHAGEAALRRWEAARPHLDGPRARRRFLTPPPGTLPPPLDV